jgi:peroxiredoxin
MPTVWRKLLSGMALAGAAGLLLLFASPTYRQGGPSLIGSEAKNFSFTLDGRSTRLSDLRGKVVVLNFWATWCPPCVEEMPALNRLHKQISARGGLVLGISVDDNAQAYEQFLREHQIEFPTYRDPAKEISSAYGTFMYPETYIIDPHGRIARKVIGPREWDREEMVRMIRDLAAK